MSVPFTFSLISAPPQVLLERLMGKLRDSPSAVLRMERGSARYEAMPAHDCWAEKIVASGPGWGLNRGRGWTEGMDGRQKRFC